MSSKESRIILFILHRLNMKRSIDRYFKRGKFDQVMSKKPNRTLQSIASISKNEIFSSEVFTAISKNHKSNTHVLYFHGGAYIYGIKNYHYNFISRVLKATGCTFTIPDYPLAPHYTVKHAFEMAIECYKNVVENSRSDKIILMGDSAGGGLALGMAQYLRNEGISQPNHVILLSPWLDVTMQNPDILSIDKHDPILSIEGLIMAGKAYAGDSDAKDPFISPIYGNFENLAPISLFTSTNDILNADARKLAQHMNKQGLRINFIEYTGLFHDWMLFDFKESGDVIAKIAGIIESTSISKE